MLSARNFSILIVFVFLSFAQRCYSQKGYRMEALNRYQIKDNDTLYQFYAVKPVKKIKYDNDKRYYWYWKDSIMITQAANNGKILHGPYIIYYPDNNLMEGGKFKYGLRNGVWKYWYPGGGLKKIITWDDGDMRGDVEEYNEQGLKTRWGTYNNNAFSGFTIERSPEGNDIKIQYKKGKKVEPADSKIKS